MNNRIKRLIELARQMPPETITGTEETTANDRRSLLLELAKVLSVTMPDLLFDLVEALSVPERVKMKKNTVATWELTLECRCPDCGTDVDLLDDTKQDLYELEPCEHDTDRSRNVEVVCPRCEHVFLVDCDY